MDSIRRHTATVAIAALVVACSASPARPSQLTATSPPATAPTTDGLESPEAEVEPTGSSGAGATATPEETDPLLATVLTDARDGATFTLVELLADGPVLLEPMAAWCSNCRAQQHEVVRAHALAAFTSVSLGVDLSESPEQLAAYAEREGFDWRFAAADADLYRSLQERFGVAATNPPSTPLIVVDPDGAVRPLEFGQGTRSAEQLIAELGLD